MTGYEIHINGKKVLSAGGDNFIGLSAVIGAYGKLGNKPNKAAVPLGSLMVMGVAEPSEDKTQSTSSWGEKLSLSVGDEIRIRFIKLREVDTPDSVHKMPAGDES